MEIPPALLNKRILIVDDDMSIRHLIKVALRTYGFNKFVEATDGARALKQLEKSGIDLIICDWEMPNMDGLELYQALQQNAGLNDIPFILLTANSGKDKVMEAINSGVTLYVVKPFTPRVITEKIVDVLKGSL